MNGNSYRFFPQGPNTHTLKIEICNQQPFEIKTKILIQMGFSGKKKQNKREWNYGFVLILTFHWRVNSTDGQGASKREEAAAISSERAQFTLLRIERTRQRRWFFFFFLRSRPWDLGEQREGRSKFLLSLDIYANRSYR